jgi:hypothetical protein
MIPMRMLSDRFQKISYLGVRELVAEELKGEAIKVTSK